MYTIYSTPTCGYCKMAKNILTETKNEYKEIIIDSEEVMTEITDKLGYRPKTVPQIWLDNDYIGGYDDLVKSMKW